MPFKRRIAEVEASIEAKLAEIANARAEAAQRAKNARADLDKLLAQLARLKAERLRLMQRQRIALKQD